MNLPNENNGEPVAIERFERPDRPFSSNGEGKAFDPALHFSSNGGSFEAREIHRHSEEIDSTSSTPYVSAPSSPGRGSTGYFFSAPASPMRFVLSTAAAPPSSKFAAFLSTVSSAVPGSFEFQFSSEFSANGSVGNELMSSAEELFLNGQIRPMKLSSHLQRPQILAPLSDLEVKDEETNSRQDLEYENREEWVTRGRDLRSRNKSLHRKARSMSPMRTAAQFEWHNEAAVDGEASHCHLELESSENKQGSTPSTETTPSDSASSSRSSSSGRNSKKWIFLKDLLSRSKSEGRSNKEKLIRSSISSPTRTSSRDEKEKKGSHSQTHKQNRNKQVPCKTPIAEKTVAKRRVPPSAHELHYTANRAQTEEMKKKTFLPYRQGLLGYLGFSSKGMAPLMDSLKL